MHPQTDFYAPPQALQAPQPDDAAGRHVWFVTVLTLVAVLVFAGGAAASGQTGFAVVVGGLAVLWAWFGILWLAAKAIDQRSGVGHAFVSCLVAVFVIPALAGGLTVMAGAQEVSNTFDEVSEDLDSFGDTGNSDYDACMEDSSTTWEECERLLD